MVVGLLLLFLSGLGVVLYIGYEIDNNTRHNETVLELAEHIEQEARLVSIDLLPAFQALHSLDLAVSKHLAEFQFYTLDADRDPTLLRDTLSSLQFAFVQLQQDAPTAIAAADRAALEELIGVLVDITREGLDIESPNQLVQLLSDSEDVINEYVKQVRDIRLKLDSTVVAQGEDISLDMGIAKQNLTEQKSLLSRLKYATIGSLTLMLLFLISVTVLLFRILQNRLSAVADYASAISDGEYTAMIRCVSPDRIGDMANSVAHMGARMAALVKDAELKADTAVRAQKAALKLANFDTLTNLPNRKHFFDILESTIDEARRLQEKVAVAYLDLDDFKKVNDTFGHAVGDELLCAVATRLRHSVRESDLMDCGGDDVPSPKLSRLGGDEFTFLMARLHDKGEAQKIACRVLDALARPYVVSGREFTITPSLGVAMFPDDGTTVEELLRNADMAMYRAKDRGRNNVALYSREIGEDQRQRLLLERDLAKAVERGELGVHYQPKVDLQSRRIIGAEALLRWNHPQRGPVSPGDFIPLAEESGLIVPIGNWVLQQVCEQLAYWRGIGIDPVPIAVNVSGKQLTSGNLVGMVSECLEASCIPAGLIQLELTESILMNDTELAIVTLKSLRAMEVRTSLDDFGTGYSSLSYLKRFCLSELKIDRSFVNDIETDADDAAIVKAILGLAESLGLNVVAEGIENKNQMEYLKKRGCQIGQGFLFGRPMPADDLEQLLVGERIVSVA